MPSTGPVEGTSISAGEIHVWRARLDSAGWAGAEGLPEPDRERAERMRRPEPQRRWVAARWALRGVLGRYLGEDPEGVELGTGSHGKPVLRRPTESLRFNLSHTRDLALIAVARGLEVGVDVEWIDPRRENRPAAFYAAWTRREAIAKCLGVGLAAPLPEGDVAVSAFDAGPGFAAAVAVAGREALPLRSFAIEPDLSPSGAG